MSREVLVPLLGTLLVMNVGVLISVGLLSRRGRARQGVATTARDVGQPYRDAMAMAAVAVPLGATPVRHVAPLEIGPREASPALSAAPAVEPVAVATMAGDREDEVVAGNGHLEHQSAALATVADAAMPIPEVVTAGRAAMPAGDSLPLVDGVPSAAISTNGNFPVAPEGKRRRSRRFVLPPLEEDSDRSARAIEAFLGEDAGSPRTPQPERLHRRRHRARRAPGSKASRMSLVIELVGYASLSQVSGEGAAARLASALAETLWRSARIGDEVRELAPGKIQIVLDCDAVGAEAFAERARALVAPWLSASALPLGLEVSSVLSAPPSGAGAAAG
jgi:hypothetical protein